MMRSAIFDFDGVLVDSLPAHLRYCRRIAQDFHLAIKIPAAEAFKDTIIQTGIVISPMVHFFRALGFSDEDARKADKRYRVEFRKEALPLFDGVPGMLSRLRENGVELGLVTANVRNVVETALGPLANLFSPGAIFADDDVPKRTKAEAIAEAVRALGLSTANATFVGDQLADYRAAQSAGVDFVGVTYGWGISRENARFPIVDTVADLTDYILARNPLDTSNTEGGKGVQR
jgi:phosphoglycolate phosphatase